jgi:hypothetical protein
MGYVIHRRCEQYRRRPQLVLCCSTEGKTREEIMSEDTWRNERVCKHPFCFSARHYLWCSMLHLLELRGGIQRRVGEI